MIGDFRMKHPIFSSVKDFFYQQIDYPRTSFSNCTKSLTSDETKETRYIHFWHKKYQSQYSDNRQHKTYVNGCATTGKSSRDINVITALDLNPSLVTIKLQDFEVISEIDSEGCANILSHKFYSALSGAKHLQPAREKLYPSNGTHLQVLGTD